MKRVIISGGGTGGHIFPAISIANALKQMDNNIEILFVGAEGKMEMEKVPEAGYKIEGLPVRGLSRRLTLGNVKVLINLWKSVNKAKKIVKRFAPDVVVGVGGYASGPMGWAASKVGIPLVLQEQNSYAGVTNKYLGKRAAKVCVAYDGMERFFKPEKIVFTGNPVRKDLADACRKREAGQDFYGLERDKQTILVTGGSLGARTLNNMMTEALETIRAWKGVQVVWQCGSYYYETLNNELKELLPENVKLTAFLKRMDLAYACSDIVVARAGAGTISELCLLGKASILIPSPNVAEDHQTCNAMALVNKGAALMIKDELAVEKFVPVVLDLLGHEEKRTHLSENMTKLGIADSDMKIAMEILKLMDKSDNK